MNKNLNLFHNILLVYTIMKYLYKIVYYYYMQLQQAESIVNSSIGVSEYQNHRVSSQEHFGDVTLSVDRVCLLTLRTLGDFGPHFANILKNHIHVTVKSLDSSKDLAVVSEGN